MKDKLIYLLGAAIFIIGTALLINIRIVTQKSSQMATLRPELPIDTVNDGVYTNYTYRFRFKYLEEIFVKQVNNNYSNNVMWFDEEDISSPIEVREDGVWMDLLIRDFEPDNKDNYEYQLLYTQAFENMYQLEVGRNSSWGAEILSKEETGNVKRITYIFEALPGREYSVGYFGWWEKGGLPVISLGVSANNFGTLEKYMEEFNNIVNSFEYF